MKIKITVPDGNRIAAFQDVPSHFIDMVSRLNFQCLSLTSLSLLDMLYSIGWKITKDELERMWKEEVLR